MIPPIFGSNPTSPTPPRIYSDTRVPESDIEGVESELPLLFYRQVTVSEQARTQKVEKLTYDQKEKLAVLEGFVA
jgi:hypothetical protein